MESRDVLLQFHDVLMSARIVSVRIVLDSESYLLRLRPPRPTVDNPHAHLIQGYADVEVWSVVSLDSPVEGLM